MRSVLSLSLPPPPRGPAPPGPPPPPIPGVRISTTTNHRTVVVLQLRVVIKLKDLKRSWFECSFSRVSRHHPTAPSPQPESNALVCRDISIPLDSAAVRACARSSLGSLRAAPVAFAHPPAARGSDVCRQPTHVCPLNYLLGSLVCFEFPERCQGRGLNRTPHPLPLPKRCPQASSIF